MEIHVNAVCPPAEESLDLLQYAWTIIANVSEGNWGMQPGEWQVAAMRFRDQYHVMLSDYYITTGKDGTRAPEQP